MIKVLMQVLKCNMAPFAIGPPFQWQAIVTWHRNSYFQGVVAGYRWKYFTTIRWDKTAQRSIDWGGEERSTMECHIR